MRTRDGQLVSVSVDSGQPEPPGLEAIHAEASKEEPFEGSYPPDPGGEGSAELDYEEVQEGLPPGGVTDDPDLMDEDESSYRERHHGEPTSDA
jgi:hypothetical protein